MAPSSPRIAAFASLAAVAVAAHSGTCPATKVCNASVGSDAGRPCCQVKDDTYECCYSGEGCVPNVGCRCTSKQIRLVNSYAGYSFQAYLAEHEKSYGEETEYQLRKMIFESNLQAVRRHNARYAAGEESWYMKMNKFGDWSHEEFKGLLASRPTSRNYPVLQLSTDGNPASLDWRGKGAITAVKNQGGCGSCWAFAAVESVESHLAIATGKLLTLSPQTYVNCVKNPHKCGGPGGCSGATCELAFNLTVTAGVALEAEVPYRGHDAKCTAYKPAAKAAGYANVPVNDAKAVESALAKAGPVSVVVAASLWALYGGGSFNACSKQDDNDLNHGVQLVGYTATDWILRNSWGAGWGDDGFIRLSRGADQLTFTDNSPEDGTACEPFPRTQTVGGECGVLFDASYPVGVKEVSEEELVV